MAAICNVCGLPDELCICQEIAKEQQKATISTDSRRSTSSCGIVFIIQLLLLSAVNSTALRNIQD